MAKKKPKTNTSTLAAQNPAPAQQPEEKGKEKAAVNVESPQKPQKAKKNNQKSDKPNIFKRMWKGLKGIFSELKKVTWPKGKEVGSNTLVMLVVVVLFFVILFVIDYVLTGLLGLTTSGQWTHLWN